MKKMLFAAALLASTALHAQTKVPATSVSITPITGVTGSTVQAALQSIYTTGSSGVPTSRQIATSARLIGGGDLTADRTIDLATVISAGSCGDSTHVAAMTYDAYGRTTACTATAIAFPAAPDLSGYALKATTITSTTLTGGGDLSANRTFDLTSGIVTAGSAGDSTHVPVPTVDTYGRVTGLSSVAISFPSLTGYTPTSRQIATSARLAGGGDLTADRTLDLATVGSAGTYGDATHVPAITTDAYGRVTSVSAITITQPSLAGYVQYGVAGTFTQPQTFTVGGNALILDQTSGNARRIAGTTGGLNRWVVQIGNAISESGSNVGTDFQISRFNDAGTTIDVPLSITRSTGLVTLLDGLTVTGAITGNVTGNVSGSSGSTTGNAATATALATSRTIGTLTGDVTSPGAGFTGAANASAAATLVTTQTAAHTWNAAQTFGNNVIISAAAGTGKPLFFYTGASARWLLLSNSTAEGGSNAGSDFQITRYADAGTGIDTPFSIVRSTGVVSMPDGVVANVTGNLTGTATSLATARTIDVLTGDVTSSGASFDGSGSTTAATTLATAQPSAHTWAAGQTMTSLLTTNGGISNTGTITSTGTVNVTAGNILLNGTGTFLIDQANTANRQIIYRTAGSTRWDLYATNANEAGSNVGSDFNIRSYADDGTTALFTTVNTRSTGKWTFPADVSIAGVLTASAAVNISSAVTIGSGGSLTTNATAPATIGGLLTAGSITSAGTVSLSGGVTMNGGSVTIGSATSFTAGNTSSNFVIGGVTSTARSVTYNNFGQPTYRYDDNSAAATLGILTNYAISAINQGASIGPFKYGTGGVLGATAGQISLLTTDTWATTANQSAKWQLTCILGGVAQTCAEFDPAAGEAINSRRVHGAADLSIGTQNMSAITAQSPTIASLNATMLFTGTLTSGVTYTLPACVLGQKVRIVRTGGGAFNWTIAPTSKTMATNTWADFECSSTAFVETAAGSL